MEKLNSVFGNLPVEHFEATAQNNLILRILTHEILTDDSPLGVTKNIRFLAVAGIGVGPVKEIDEPEFKAAIEAAPISSALYDGDMLTTIAGLHEADQIEQALLARNDIGISNPQLTPEQARKAVASMFANPERTENTKRASLTVVGGSSVRATMQELDACAESNNRYARTLAHLSRLALHNLWQ